MVLCVPRQDKVGMLLTIICTNGKLHHLPMRTAIDDETHCGVSAIDQTC